MAKLAFSRVSVAFRSVSYTHLEARSTRRRLKSSDCRSSSSSGGLRLAKEDSSRTVSYTHLAGQDCHAVIETMRGHTLGRVIYHGSALPNTGVPGLVGGFAGERVLRAPAAGYFHPLLEIGAQVRQGDTAATVAGVPMLCTLDGILRGILPEGTPVYAGMQAGDIAPRCRLEHCFTASDKALAVGGGVLEAILHLGGMLKM